MSEQKKLPRTVFDPKPLFQLQNESAPTETEDDDITASTPTSSSAENGESSLRPPRPEVDLPTPNPSDLYDKGGKRKPQNLFTPPPSKDTKDTDDDSSTEPATSHSSQIKSSTPPVKMDPGSTQAMLSDVTDGGLLTAGISSTFEVVGLDFKAQKGTKEKVTDRFKAIQSRLIKLKERLPSQSLLGHYASQTRQWLARPLFNEKPKWDKLPQGLVKPVSAAAEHSRRYHVVVAVLGFIFGLVIIGLSINKEAPSKPEPAKQAAAPVEVSETIEATVETTPFADYPSFPWKEHLENLLKAADKSSIYELFGVSPKFVVSTLGELSFWGPSTYDLLPETSTLEVFPKEYQNAFSPRMIFLFKKDKLFEIELSYGSAVAGNLDDDAFSKFATKSSRKSTDRAGRVFHKHIDKGVIIEQSHHKDKYGRVFRSVSFSNRETLESFRKKDVNRKEALNAYALAMTQLSERQLDEAIVGFREARASVPTFGNAYVMEAIAFLNKQDFSRAEFLAHTALGKTHDKRAKAEANGIKAITHLYKGKKDEALEFWKKASSLDPLNTGFQVYKNELENGIYTVDRIAKTKARINCITSENQKTKSQLIKGMLARGNFPDITTYSKALALAVNDPNFAADVKKWTAWECQ